VLPRRMAALTSATVRPAANTRFHALSISQYQWKSSLPKPHTSLPALSNSSQKSVARPDPLSPLKTAGVRISMPS